jgi:hypothetical protein
MVIPSSLSLSSVPSGKPVLQRGSKTRLKLRYVNGPYFPALIAVKLADQDDETRFHRVRPSQAVSCCHSGFRIMHGFPRRDMRKGEGVVIVGMGAGTVDISTYQKPIGVKFEQIWAPKCTSRDPPPSLFMP